MLVFKEAKPVHMPLGYYIQVVGINVVLDIYVNLCPITIEK